MKRTCPLCNSELSGPINGDAYKCATHGYFSGRTLRFGPAISALEDVVSERDPLSTLSGITRLLRG